MTTIGNNVCDAAASSSSLSASSTATVTDVNMTETCTFTQANVVPASKSSSSQQEQCLQQQQQYQQLQKIEQQQNHPKLNYYHPPPALGNSLHYIANSDTVGDVATSANSTSANCTNSLATASRGTAKAVTGATTLKSNLENGAIYNSGYSNNNNFSSNYNNNSSNSRITANATRNKVNSTPSPITVPHAAVGNSTIGHKPDRTASHSAVGTISTSVFKTQQLNASGEDVVSLGGSLSTNSQTSTINNNHITNNNETVTTVNGCVTSRSDNHNLSGILKGSKENLLQNNYYNGSVAESISGIEGFGPVPLNISERDDPDDGLGPLPSKWQTAYTERGELYFIDHNTGTSHWLDPRLSKYQKKSLEECGEDELPYGWEKIEDSLYGTYYIDHVNRKTQYENPVLEAKRRAAEQKQHEQQLLQPHQLPQQRPQTPSSSSVLNGTSASIVLSSVSSASTLSTVDISQRGMQPMPAMSREQNANKSSLLAYKFTRNPTEMQGQRITTTLLKSKRGLGITIVGGDDGVEEYLQIKSIVPNGPAWLDGQLQMGDVLVYVNDTCVLGFTHHEMVNVFQSIMPGETVSLEVCRGYPLPFDPNDPNTEVVTTIAVDGMSSHETEKQRRMLMDRNYNFIDMLGKNSNINAGGSIDNTGFILMKKPEVHTLSIIKGAMGFGFTITDSSYGQKVKKILDRSCCNLLHEGDILLEINEIVVRNKSHTDVVQILKDCSKTEPTLLKIQRPATSTATPNGTATSSIQQQAVVGNSGVAKVRKNFLGAKSSGIGNNAIFRSKTPTADLYSTMQKEILPIRPKTPLVDTRRARVNTPNIELNEGREVAAVNTSAQEPALERSLVDTKTHLHEGTKSQNSLSEIDVMNNDIPFMDPYPKLVTSLSEGLAGVPMPSDMLVNNGGTAVAGYLRTTASGVPNYENQGDYVSAGSGNYSSIYGLAQMPPVMSPLSGGLYGPPAVSPAVTANMIPQNTASFQQHHESCFCYDCQDFRSNRLKNSTHQQQQHSPRSYYTVYHPTNHGHSQYSPASTTTLHAAHIQNERMQKRVNELLNDRRRVGFPPLDHQHHNEMQGNTGISSSVGGRGSGYSPSHPHGLHQHQTHGVMNQQQHSPVQHHLSNWPSNAGLTLNSMQPSGVLSRNGFPETGDILDGCAEQFVLSEVTLHRQALGFGFRIVGGTEEGSQVTVGHIVPGGKYMYVLDNIHSTDTMYNPTSVSYTSSASSSPTFLNSSQPNIPNLEDVRIKILEQPAMKGLRFRYICEGRSAGSIPGVNSTHEHKTFPTIEIEGYKGTVKIVVSCVTKDEPYRPHPHNLVGKEGCKYGLYMSTINGPPMRAVFSNLGIQCVKKKDIKAALEEREIKRIDPFKTGFEHKDQPSSIDLNVVRLCFQAFITIPGIKKHFPIPPVVSDPVFDKKFINDLVICRLCNCSAKVTGGDKIILLCEKVPKDDIKVRFFELRNNEVIWEDFGEFQQTDVHKQTAIAFKTPRYVNPDVNNKVQVYIQLYRPSDGETSEALPFELYPDPDNIKRKRIKTAGNPMILLREIQQLEQNQIQCNISNGNNMGSSFMCNMQLTMHSPSSNIFSNSEIKAEPSLSTNYITGSYRNTYITTPSPQPASPLMNRNISTPSPNLLRNSSGDSQTKMSNMYNNNQMNQEQYQNLSNNFKLATTISCKKNATAAVTNDCNISCTTNTFFKTSKQNNDSINITSPKQEAQFDSSNIFINRTSGGSFTRITPNYGNTDTNNINTQLPYLAMTSNNNNKQMPAILSNSNNITFNQFQERNVTAESSLFHLSQLDDLVPLQNSEELRISNLSIST